MLKRFTIGFVVGIGLMYWYIHYSEETIAGAQRWMDRSASEYRGDRVHQALDEENGKRRR